MASNSGGSEYNDENQTCDARRETEATTEGIVNRDVARTRTSPRPNHPSTTRGPHLESVPRVIPREQEYQAQLTSRNPAYSDFVNGNYTYTTRVRLQRPERTLASMLSIAAENARRLGPTQTDAREIRSRLASLRFDSRRRESMLEEDNSSDESSSGDESSSEEEQQEGEADLDQSSRKKANSSSGTSGRQYAQPTPRNPGKASKANEDEGLDGDDDEDLSDRPNYPYGSSSRLRQAYQQIPCFKDGCKGCNPTISQLLSGAETHCEFSFCAMCCQAFPTKIAKDHHIGTCTAHCIASACQENWSYHLEDLTARRHIRTSRCPKWKQLPVPEIWQYLYCLRNPDKPPPSFDYIEGEPEPHGNGRKRKRRQLRNEVGRLNADLQRLRSQEESLQHQDERLKNIVRQMWKALTEGGTKNLSEELRDLLKQDFPDLAYDYKPSEAAKPRWQPYISQGLDALSAGQAENPDEGFVTDAHGRGVDKLDASLDHYPEYSEQEMLNVFDFNALCTNGLTEQHEELWTL